MFRLTRRNGIAGSLPIMIMIMIMMMMMMMMMMMIIIIIIIITIIIILFTPIKSSYRKLVYTNYKVKIIIMRGEGQDIVQTNWCPE